MADVWANFMACHPRATCHVAGCCHLLHGEFNVMIPELRVTLQGAATGDFNGMSSQSHVSHCRVVPLGEFTVMIPVPHATLQGAVTWWNQCHDRAMLQGVIIPFAILKIVFRHILFYFIFVFNAVWALTSGSFRIVSDTLVTMCSNCATFVTMCTYFGLKCTRISWLGFIQIHWTGEVTMISQIV